MKAKHKVLLTTVVLLLLTHRLPAPITEIPESPTPAPEQSAKPKSKRVKPEPAEAEVPSISKSAGKFDGTWKHTWSEVMPWKTRGTHLIVIRNGKTAEHVEEWLGELHPGQGWLWLPEPYNKISPLYRKKRSNSVDLVVDGSKLTIRWPGTRIVDWSPKSIPRNVIQPRLDEPMVVTYTLEGDQLVTDRKDVFQRVK